MAQQDANKFKVLPVRNFIDNSWHSMSIIIDDKISNTNDQRKKWKLKYGENGVDFYDLAGPINQTQLTTNQSICAPKEKVQPMNNDKLHTLTYWAYPNGEFLPIKTMHETPHLINWEGNGNPNGSTLADSIVNQPSQPTIPVIPGQNQPNVNLDYASYRSVAQVDNDTGWTTPQYYRAAYNASDMECAISTRPYVQNNAGSRKNFPVLMMENGYKLLSSDGTTVVTTSELGEGKNILVTCNPGLNPRDETSQEYLRVMSNYCSADSASYYADSKYAAYPNPNRTDEEGNPLGYGTLNRFNSPTCQTFCTLYPKSCKAPFEQFCNVIGNWTLQGTCYAMANIVKNADEQTAVVPTLSTLCQNTNLDNDVCKTFCFQQNMDTLNCGPNLKNYCSGLVKEALRNGGTLNMTTTSQSLASTLTLATDLFTFGAGLIPQYSTGDSVILTDTTTPTAQPNFNYIAFRGYIGVSREVTVVEYYNGTSIVNNIPLFYHGTYFTKNLFGKIIANDKDNRIITLPISDATYTFTPGIIINISNGAIYNDPGNTFGTANGYYVVITAGAGLLKFQYPANSALKDAIVGYNHVNGFVEPAQPLLYWNGYEDMPTNPATWKGPDASTTWAGNGTNVNKFTITKQDILPQGSALNLITFELNVFNYIETVPTVSPATYKLSLTSDTSGSDVNDLIIPYTFPSYTGTTTSQTLSNLTSNSLTISFPSMPGSNPTIRKTPDGLFVEYSDDAVQAAALAVYDAHPQCPCFMPDWVYNHYYNELLSEFPNSPQLNAFQQTIVKKPFCTYPQCAQQNNGATSYRQKVYDETCPAVAYCISNAEISITGIGNLVKTSFAAGDPANLSCNSSLSTFSVYQDTRLLSKIVSTTKLYDIVYNNVNNSILSLQLCRASPTGGLNTPVIPVPPSVFRGYISGTTLTVTQKIKGVYPPIVPTNNNLLFGQGVRNGTYITAGPVTGTEPNSYTYTINLNYATYGTTVGSINNQVDISIQGNKPEFWDAATDQGLACDASYYVPNNKTKTVTPIKYQIGDYVHVYECNTWQTFDNVTPTVFEGYISNNPADPNPSTGPSLLTVVKNQGPVAPGLMRSTNGVLANTRITTLLTGNGRPFSSSSSTWLLNTHYTVPLGSATAPVQMFISPDSVARYVSGFVKNIYPSTNRDVNNVLFTMMDIECHDTNEDLNQLQWSNTSSDYRSMNAAGELSNVYSIHLDLDDSVTPAGEAITADTWEEEYDFDYTTGPENIELFDQDHPVVKESGQTILVVLVIVFGLILMIIVGYFVIRRKQGVLKEMAKENHFTKHTLNEVVKSEMKSDMIGSSSSSSSEFPTSL